MSRYPSGSEASLGRPGSYVSASCGSLARQRTSSVRWTCVTKESSLPGLVYISRSGMLDTVIVWFYLPDEIIFLYLFISLQVSLLTQLAKLLICRGWQHSCQVWQPTGSATDLAEMETHNYSVLGLAASHYHRWSVSDWTKYVYESYRYTQSCYIST